VQQNQPAEVQQNVGSLQEVHYTVELQNGTVIEYYKQEPAVQKQARKKTLFQFVKEKIGAMIPSRAENRKDRMLPNLLQKIVNIFRTKINSRSDIGMDFGSTASTVFFGLASIAVAGIFSIQL